MGCHRQYPSKEWGKIVKVPVSCTSSGLALCLLRCRNRIAANPCEVLASITKSSVRYLSRKPHHHRNTINEKHHRYSGNFRSLGRRLSNHYQALQKPQREDPGSDWGNHALSCNSSLCLVKYGCVERGLCGPMLSHAHSFSKWEHG